MVNRLRVLVAIMSFMLVVFPVMSKERSGVQMAVDLKATGEQAKQNSIPVMMFFAAEDCGFCERLEADHLHNMANSNEYQKKIIIRKVVIDSYGDLRNFSGKVVDNSTFSDDYNIQVTPTLVLVDNKGVRVGRRIVGYNGSDFFGTEIDNVIELATQKIR